MGKRAVSYDSGKGLKGRYVASKGRSRGLLGPTAPSGRPGGRTADGDTTIRVRLGGLAHSFWAAHSLTRLRP